MVKAAKIERTQKAFLKAMKAKFAEDPTASTKTRREMFMDEGIGFPQYLAPRNYAHLTLLPYHTVPFVIP